MVSLSTWFRYAAHKFEYSISLSWKKYNVGQINSRELTDAICKNFFQGKLTFTHWPKEGEAMAPIVSATGGTLLVRKLANLTPAQVFVGDVGLLKDPEKSDDLIVRPLAFRQVFVGDVILLKDPEKTDDLIVRRLAALEGYEMASSDEKDEPFVLDKGQCWVLADNHSLKPKEARDSRLFGPVPMTDILGRAIYSLRNAVDHGPVENSRMAMNEDSPVLAVELDVEEMAKNNKM